MRFPARLASATLAAALASASACGVAAADGPRGRVGRAWAPPTTTTTTTRPAPSPASRAVAYAQAQLGKPYAYGAAGPSSFDCSGLTLRAWEAGGVRLPRTAAQQYSAVRRIPMAELRPGDLVFAGDLKHVGIYVGGGKLLHAPKPGDVVKVSTIWSAMRLAGRPA